MINKKINIHELIILSTIAFSFTLLQHFLLKQNLLLKMFITILIVVLIKIIMDTIRLKNLKIFFNLLDSILKLKEIKENTDLLKNELDDTQIDYLKSIEKIVKNNESLLKISEANNRALKNIIKINNKILQYADSESLNQYVLEKAIDTIPGATHGSLMKAHEDYTCEIIAVHGFDESILHTSIDFLDSFLWQNTNGLLDRAVIIGNVARFNEENLNAERLKILQEKATNVTSSAISAPIIIDGALWGAINVDAVEKDLFTEQDADILMFYAAQIANIIKRKTILDKDLYLSRYDALTNIYNRGYFNLIINEHEKKAKRFKDTFSIIIIDIDNLKEINDNFGHSVGDKILQDLVFITKNSIREIDIFARLNEDEFIIVLPEKNEAQCETLISSIKKQIEERNSKSKHKFDFSYGIAGYPEESEEIHSLMELADDKMYANRKNK